MKKLRYVLIIILIIAGVAAISFTSGYKYANRELRTDEIIDSSYGSNLSGIHIVDASGKDMDVPFGSTEADYKVVLYISSICSSCAKEIDTAKHLKEVLNAKHYEVYVLYEDKIVKERDEDPFDNTYCMADGRLSLNTPGALILDKDNKVVFCSDDTSTLMEKIISIESADEIELMRNHANEYLISFLDHDDFDNSKPTMIYFRMEGCPDCIAVEPILDDAEVASKFNRVDLYTEASFGEEDLVDSDRVFRNLFEIDWYPSFELISDTRTQILGEMPEEDLIRALNDF